MFFFYVSFMIFFHLSVLSSEINRGKNHYYTACTTNEVGFPMILPKKNILYASKV